MKRYLNSIKTILSIVKTKLVLLKILTDIYKNKNKIIKMQAEPNIHLGRITATQLAAKYRGKRELYK